jgi:hypothetical protein
MPSTRSELIRLFLLGIIIAIPLLLKLTAILHFRVDSDEPQHAHVVWGWTTGHLQYRDIFDNHMPLFHILCAPYFALFGEYSNIMLPLRIAMVPLYAACIWLVYRLGAILFSKRWGIWACVTASLLPAFFYPSTEFRPDNLWAVCWFLSLAVAISGEFTFKRAFVLGLLTGVTAIVSTKTVFLGAALAISAGMTFGLRAWIDGKRPVLKECFPYVFLIMCGAIIPFGLVAAYFAANGAFHAFLYGVFFHNMVPGLKRWGNFWSLGWIFPATLPFLAAYGAFVIRQAPTVPAGTRRVLILLTPYLYAGLMYSYCPDLSRQDNLPLVPLLPLTVVPVLTALRRRLPRFELSAAKFSCVLLAILLAEGAWTWSAYDLTGKGVRRLKREISLILKITNKGDYVMDAKGEYVFRNRSYYWGFEPVTRARLRQGSIIDDIPECLERTATKVSYFYVTYPGTASAIFIARNYLPFNPAQPDVGVAGKIIGSPARATPCGFDVTIPASYRILSDTGETKGELDGTTYKGPAYLNVGHHIFVREAGDGRLAIMWARALDMGYHPMFGQSERIIKTMSANPH